MPAGAAPNRLTLQCPLLWIKFNCEPSLEHRGQIGLDIEVNRRIPSKRMDGIVTSHLPFGQS
jgi:hypothetical protein